MKPIKTFGLAALAALTAMAFVGASSAMATGSTSLCTHDETLCAAGNIVTHVHEVSNGHVKFLSTVVVECNALFLGDALNGGLGNPLVIHGAFTYTCLNGCTVTEENGPAEKRLLRLGSELADTTLTFLVHIVCAPLNCRYNAVLQGHRRGPLAAEEKGGEEAIQEAVANKESGTFCPSTTRFDGSFSPLVADYISS